MSRPFYYICYMIMEYNRMLDTVRNMLTGIKHIDMTDLGTSLYLYFPFSPGKLCIRFQMSKLATFTVFKEYYNESLQLLILNDANSIKFENSVYLIMQHILHLYNNHKQMCDLSAIYEHCKEIIALDEL